MTWVVGLTGGIGSGKSAVADAFAALGVPVIDADLISHQLTAADGTAMLALREAFGAWCVRDDGALDRAAMRARVFTEPGLRAQLNAILHPLIRQQCQAQLAAASGTYALLVAPLLLESEGYVELVRRILVVDCPENLQIARVIARSGLAGEQVAAIIGTQLPRAERLRRADDVIDNSTTLAALTQQVREMHQRYVGLVP